MNGGTILCGFGCDIFFLSSLSVFSALLEDVLECTTRAYTVFPCGPSAAAVVSAARCCLESVCNPHRNPPLLQSVPSDFYMTLDRAAKPASPYRAEIYGCKVIESAKKRNGPVKLNLRSSKTRSYLIIKFSTFMYELVFA